MNRLTPPLLATVFASLAAVALGQPAAPSAPPTPAPAATPPTASATVAPAASSPATPAAPAANAEAAQPPAAPKPDLGGDVLVFSYFKGNGDGLHLAWSDDGLKWQALKNDQIFLKPAIGKARLMRDPSIVRGPDGTFHLVWTSGWTENNIGYSSSKDLVNWTEQKEIPVMAHEPTVRNTWAPEVFYDAATQEFQIIWASTIPGRFPNDGQDARATSGYNHRMYVTRTKDFKDFTKAELFYDPKFNVIDCFIVKDGDKYVMILKDETAPPLPVQKNLKVATSDKAAGPFGPASEAFSGRDWAEGPAVIKVGDQWYVYFDKYIAHRYGLLATKDWKTWEDLSPQLQLPPGIRHGTVFRAPKALVEAAAQAP